MQTVTGLLLCRAGRCLFNLVHNRAPPSQSCSDNLIWAIRRLVNLQPCQGRLSHKYIQPCPGWWPTTKRRLFNFAWASRRQLKLIRTGRRLLNLVRVGHRLPTRVGR